MADERDDLVVLVDDNGDEVEFEHLDTIEMNETEYVVLLPVIQEDEETDEVVILKLQHGDDSEDSFISVEDDDELKLVFDEFKTRMEDEYEFEE